MDSIFVSLQTSYVEILPTNVMILGEVASGRRLGLGED